MHGRPKPIPTIGKELAKSAAGDEESACRQCDSRPAPPPACHPWTVNVLLVEDDDAIAEPLAKGLEHQGFVVHRESTGIGGVEAFRSGKGFDMILLDLGLPDIDGYEVCRRVRSDSQVPIIILTARGDEIDRVLGLELGADDYMVKPFDVREFEARVRSILRRQAGLRASAMTLGPLHFDLTARRFTLAGEAMDLPARELALLELLVLRAGRVVGKEAIVQSLTNLDESLSDNAIEQYVSRLRRRLQPHGLTLRTARGLGYMLERPADG